MGYAEVGALKGRAGRLSEAWGPKTLPSDADLEQFLEQVSGLVDAHLAGLGVSVPVTDASALSALESLVADGALILAVEATWPGSSGPGGVTELLAGARARFYGADGRSPNVGLVLPVIETVSASMAGASDLWSDEGIGPDDALANEKLTIGRSMRF